MPNQSHHSGRGLAARLRRLVSHRHDTTRPLADTGLEGIRAAKVSLAGLGITAALQAGVVAFTGSVALLSDTLHNLTDALTAVPLWIAFALGRRPPTRRYTFGLHRAEDLAGLLIVVAIAASAGGVAWESMGRLMDPRPLDHIPWVIAAGFIGAAGNELVARYRIRVGRRIGSEALVTDGHHARADALTSLAVVGAGFGAAAGVDWVDPVAGLVVAALIVLMVRHAAVRMFGRLLDAVDPELVDRAETAARQVDGVMGLDRVQLRWQGHRLLATMSIAVDSRLTLSEGHEVAQAVAHRLFHTFPFAVETLVHVDPAGVEDAHFLTAHHDDDDE